MCIIKFKTWNYTKRSQNLQNYFCFFSFYIATFCFIYYIHVHVHVHVHVVKLSTCTCTYSLCLLLFPTKCIALKLVPV